MSGRTPTPVTPSLNGILGAVHLWQGSGEGSRVAPMDLLLKCDRFRAVGH